MKDIYGAYRHLDIRAEKLTDGPLDDLSYAVKDVFAIKGYVSGAGSPDWARTHYASERHAAVIERLLRSGANMNGLTHTDEMMFSLNGENYHYGTPINPKAEQRIPGGSSSGSAVAVAAGLADFAIGTDTGGSVRIPSSYCGVYGFRPTHNRVPMEGVIPLAPTFDTVGWMAASAKMLALVGVSLLDGGGTHKPAFRRLIVAEDAMAIADKETREVMTGLLDKLALSLAVRESYAVSKEGLDTWMNTFKVLQGTDIWQTHGEWIETVKPRFGPGVAERFAWTRTLISEEYPKVRLTMDNIRSGLYELLGDDGLIAIPTAPGPAPLRNTQGEDLENRRSRTLQLSCIAGLGGLPQVTLPLATIEGSPVGLSLIAGPGRDGQLLQWVAEWEESQESFKADI
jgi:amidase